MAQREYMQNPTVTRGEAAAIDQGLQAYMSKVYALMAGAMVITGFVAYVVGMDYKAVFTGGEPLLMSPGLVQTMLTSPVVYIIMFAPLAFIFLFGAMVNRVSAGTAQMLFWAFGAVMGLSIAWIFAVFTSMSIAQTFFATAVAFGALSIWGYTTKKDLSGMGTFLLMGVIGLIVASVINIFLGSEPLAWAISIIGILIFAGLTAYDTQRIKNEYLHMRTAPGGEAYLEKGAIMGALSLYINFINMFMFLLQFMGDRE